jgi:hypothetical protein
MKSRAMPFPLKKYILSIRVCGVTRKLMGSEEK